MIPLLNASDFPTKRIIFRIILLFPFTDASNGGSDGSVAVDRVTPPPFIKLEDALGKGVTVKHSLISSF